MTDTAAGPEDTAVLGAMLLDPAVIGKVVELLEPWMLRDERHRLVFRTIQRLVEHGTAVDLVTVRAGLDGQLEQAGGDPFLIELLQAVPTAAHVEDHARIVRERAYRREIAKLAGTLNDATLSAEQLGALAHQLLTLQEALGAGTATQREGPLLRSLRQLLEDPNALAAPEPVLPRIGFRGRLTLLAGREKMGGKSTLLTAGAAAVTRGGLFLAESCPIGAVLWVTADQEHAGDLAARATRFGADPDRLHVLWPHRPLLELTGAIERVQPLLVVIDTLANFAHGEVEDPHSSAQWPQVLLPLVRLARHHELALVVSHHTKKAEGGGYRDSTAIGALVDLLLELQPDVVNPTRRNVSVLGRWPAQPFAVELLGDRYRLVPGGELSMDARVLAFIQEHPDCSQSAIRNHLGGRAQDVDATIGRLLSGEAIRDVGSDRRHAFRVASAAPGEAPDAKEEPPDDELPF